MLKDIQKKYEELTNFLINNNITITTMESCTAGLIASLLTDIDNSSKIIKGAFVTYSNDAKIMQGVSKNIIEKYGVYSKETAIEMARVCKDIYKSNIGLGVTGTLGIIDINNKDSKQGVVYFAFDFFDKIYSYKINFVYQGSKFLNKIYVANEIQNELIKVLKSGNYK